MSEFELSTLAVLALLLFAVGAYSYWQVHRAQKAQEARKAELAEFAVEPPSQHRYPAYVPEQEPLRALTEMTPVGKVPLPELPHDYFLCHPDYELHCWQPKSVAHSWH